MQKKHANKDFRNLTNQLADMTDPLERFPDKQQGVPLDNPLLYFPLTRDNIKHNLPLILRQLLSYDLQDLKKYELIPRQLYTPGAKFDYPAAACKGIDAICQFWNGFLIGRALQRNDIRALHVDIAWDPEKLQAFVQMEAWQHIRPLAWVDWLIKMPSWKVSSIQVMQFEEYPSDGPGALRLAFHEELADQFVFLGLIPMGLYTIRTDPGTPLNWMRDAVRNTTAQVIATSTPVLTGLLEAVGWIKQ